ncbi:UDP-N-acetylglucosamine 2-epimerase (non-hydrolyzing) [bacterium]|nr:UDP-N-acetylglucosamine 2-epimerase (non-hydrolyzing) [bacterium]
MKTKLKTLLLVGTRPNLMKIAPLMKAMEEKGGFEPILVHSGQHYDQNMSQVFFEQLQIPKPDYHLGVGSGKHGEQIAKTLIHFEEVVVKLIPRLIVVVGDVNSTVAGALVGTRYGIKVAHVEAGLRSFNWEMPEEQNRVLTDRLSDFLFTHSPEAEINLLNEGIDSQKIFFVGNIMIDSLVRFRAQARERSTILKRLQLTPGSYSLLTLHRPSNVDTKEGLEKIIRLLRMVQERIKIIYPIHPRTQKSLDKFGLSYYLKDLSNLVLIEPIGYLDFLSLTEKAKLVMTDSGGIQEETTYLNIPCLTLREETERPITVLKGTNTIVGTDEDRILAEIENILNGNPKRGIIPELWDGKTSERIINILLEKFD